MPWKHVHGVRDLAGFPCCGLAYVPLMNPALRTTSTSAPCFLQRVSPLLDVIDSCMLPDTPA